MKKFILFFASIPFIFSCSTSSDVVSNKKIQKRKYTKGFDIKNKRKLDFNNYSLNEIDQKTFNENKKIKSNLILNNNIYSNESENENLLASSKNIIINNKKELISLTKKVQELSDLEGDCDNIIYKTGKEVYAKVIEITTDVVKFKRCSNLDGPLISVKKSELLMIRYKNGEKEVFNNSKSDNSKNDSDSNNSWPNWSSIVGLLLSDLGLFFAFIFYDIGTVFGGLGLLFSIISLVLRNNEKSNGKKSLIYSIIAGISGIAAIIIDQLLY